MKKETNGTMEIIQHDVEGKVKEDKKSTGCLPWSKSTHAFVGTILLIGLATSFYFAVRPVGDVLLPAEVLEWANNSADYKKVAPNVTMADLKLDIVRRFKHPTCNGDKNWFELYGRCFYVFTDHPPQWYVLNGCELFSGNAIDVFPNGRYGNLLSDFKTCCLNYFSMNDTVWWASQNESTKSLLLKNLKLDYGQHLNRHALPPNTNLSVRFNCSIGWDRFDNFWKTNLCSLQETYSHMCIE